MRPAFIEELRQKVGTSRLQLVTVSGVAFNDEGEVLLQLRSDTSTWATVSGVVEPDEQPADTLKREFLEETGARIEVLGLASLFVEPEQTYKNGDKAQFLNITFVVRLLDEPGVTDAESSDVQWFSQAALPRLSVQNQRRLHDACTYNGTSKFSQDI